MAFEDDKTVISGDGGESPGKLAPGEIFGQYKIIRLLGRGGMGEVYKVEHVDLGVRYALKIILPEILDSVDALERFRREAQVMAKMDHPNLLRVDDFGKTGNRYWLRMELAEGIDYEGQRWVSLQDAVKSGVQLPESWVRQTLTEILEGLKTAHERGLVHRDLKPANILLTPKGAKIADFGLVKVVGEEWLRSKVEKSVALSMSMGSQKTEILGGSGQAGTSTKALLGTYAYMSPEQKRGENADAQSDVYAVGLMAYQMLTGEESLGMERPSELVNELSPAWDVIILKSTKQNCQERFADADEMLSNLSFENLTKKESKVTKLEDTQAKIPSVKAKEASGSVPPPVVATSAYSYAKDPLSLTSFLVQMLWISLGFEILSILSDIGQMFLLEGAYTEAEAEANDLRQGLIALGHLGVFIVTGITFLKWIYRANLNCRGFGAEGMKFTPGWSIGYYFIPILNLVLPYKAMKEIWRVSHDPKNWKAQSGSELLGWWWALWLISTFLGEIVFRMSMDASTIEALQVSTGISILLSFVGIILCLVAINLVKTISSKQESIVNNG